MSSSGFDFEDLDGRLGRLAAGIGAADLDGSLVGYLVAGGIATASNWLPALALDALSQSLAGSPDSVFFESYFSRVGKRLDDHDAAFVPLLPGDDQELGARVAALSQWCRGFIGGLGLGGIGRGRQLSADSSEILRDFERIATTEFEFGDSAAEDEDALSELVEYVRVGVLLLRENLFQRSVEATRH